MRILLISGTPASQPCGVGDFTNSLYNALDKEDIHIELLDIYNWKIYNVLSIIRQIKEKSPTLIHFQYPTNGFKYSLVPQLVSLLFPSVTTIHEFSQTNFLRKLSYFFFLFRSRLVFTTKSERLYFSRFYFWTDVNNMSVIPIGSSIEYEIDRKLLSGLEENSTPTITYFGLLRPRKGIEDVVRLANLIKEQGHNIRIVIVGKTVVGLESYAKALQNSTRHLAINWNLNFSDSEVSALLAKTTLMYLPFPDGASMRRSSLFAALSLGNTILTTKGQDTPIEMDTAVLYVSSPEEALSQSLVMLADPDKRKAIAQNALSYSSLFSWDSIAEQHIQLYNHFG